MNSFALFITGVFSPAKGALLVFSRLRWFVLAVIPFWLCFAFAIYAVVNFWSSSTSLMQMAFNTLPWLVSFSDQIKLGNISLFTAFFQGVFWFFLLVFVSYFSYILLSVIGAPFYSILSNSILVSKGVRTAESTGVLHWLGMNLRLLFLGILKITFFLIASVGLFFMAMVPLFTVFVPFIFCMMISYDCLDFSFEGMGYTLTQRLRFFKNRFPLFLGMSIPILVAGSVPGLFALTLPFFIAGATDAFALTYDK